MGSGFLRPGVLRFRVWVWYFGVRGYVWCVWGTGFEVRVRGGGVGGFEVQGFE